MAHPTDRAFAALPSSPSVSPVPASIPCAIQEREWTLWRDQRCPNERGSYRFRAKFQLLGLPVTAEWTEELRLCGMGYGESEWWPLRPCYWDGYKRYITNKTLEWSPLQAYDPERIVWEGLDLLPCPFTGKSPTIETQGEYIGAPLWRSEAIWLSSPAVPKRRWTDAKAMQAAWNARAPAQAIEARRAELIAGEIWLPSPPESK